MKSMRSFLHGARWPLRGLVFVVSRPTLYPWVILPALLTIALMFGSWHAAWQWVPHMLQAVWPRPAPGVVQNLWNGTALFLVLWVFATGVLLLYGLMGAIGAPFYDRLSQAVETLMKPATTPPFSWRVFAVDVAWSAAHSLLAFSMWVVSVALLAILSGIPVVGTLVELVCSVLFTSWFLAREMMDGVLSRRRYTFVHKLKLVWRHLPMMTGFGLCVAVLIAIPIVNFVSLPAAVVAGTLMFLEIEARGVSGAGRGS
ncbi:MAG: hypothetical protein ACI9MC_003019 [Kiritimatiellia bacterium]|jgi:uncharacterized protein involved in cysteine biosynthesis